MTAREKNLVILCIVFVVGILGTVLVIRSGVFSGNGSRNSDPAKQARIEMDNALKTARTLKGLEDHLSVKIPVEEVDAQVQSIVEKLEKVGREKNIQFKTFSPREMVGGRSKKNRAAGSKIAFDLEFPTSHSGFAGFIEGIKKEGLPYNIESMTIKGNPGQPDALVFDVEMSFYLLEPMGVSEIAKKEVEKKDA